MSEEKKKDSPRPDPEERPETFFLPPLKMVLAFFDKKSGSREKKKKDADVAQEQEKPTEKDVEKLIEKLSKKDE